jgi:hypothetical protein
VFQSGVKGESRSPCILDKEKELSGLSPRAPLVGEASANYWPIVPSPNDVGCRCGAVGEMSGRENKVLGKNLL